MAKEELIQDINTELPDNYNRRITPAKVRAVLGKMVNGLALSDVVTLASLSPLSAHRAVILNENGFLEYASPFEDTHPFKFAGLTLQAGASVEVKRVGVVTESTWNWVYGQPVWLAEMGYLTQALPTQGFLWQIATVINPTTLMVFPERPIKLG